MYKYLSDVLMLVLFTHSDAQISFLSICDITLMLGYKLGCCFLWSPPFRYMYWTDWAESRYSSVVGKIMRATMDGSDVMALRDRDLLWPNGLSLDVERSLLYWCDAYYDKIEMFDLKSGKLTVRKISQQQQKWEIEY